jgi:protein TonB
MRTENILKADVLDILFENRNKSYGAYALRKHYNERLYKALGLVFLLAACLCLLVLLKKNTPGKNIIDVEDVFMVNLKTMELPTPKPVIKIPLQPKQPAATPKLNTQQFTAQIKVVDDKTVASKLPKNLDSFAIASTTQAGLPGVKPLVKMPGVKDGFPTSVSLPVKAVDKLSPAMSAEIMPSFPGGMEALRQFLQRNLGNPQDLNPEETVSVKIKFIVGYDGVLKGFDITEDGGPAFNNEVIRVLKLMPKWIPGKTGGENVSVFYTIPVKFVGTD